MSYSHNGDLLKREFEQWYRTMPSDVSGIIAGWNGAASKNQFERKRRLYSLAATQLDIKIFRHFPFFFELNAGQPRTCDPAEGLSGLSYDRITDAEYAAYAESLTARELAILPQRLFAPHLQTRYGVLIGGTSAIRARIRESAARAQAQRRRDFCAQAEYALDALEQLSARFTSMAGHMAEYEIDAAVRQRLTRMSAFDITAPARTLYEALQAIIFWREAQAAFDGVECDAWGCLDVELDGIDCSGEDSAELIQLLLTYHALRDPHARRSLTLGYKPNDVTLTIMDAINDDVLSCCDVYIYTGEGDDAEYLRRVRALMRRGAHLINRDVVNVPVDMTSGRATESGAAALCGVTINLAAALMGTLMPELVDNWSGLHIDNYSGEFFAAEDVYRAALDNTAALITDIIAHIDRLMRQSRPLPLLMRSIASPSCIGRARDITDEGETSTVIAVAFDGVGVFVRSMAALYELCYRRPRVPLYKLKAALSADFEGDDALQALLSAPHKDTEDSIYERLSGDIAALFPTGQEGVRLMPVFTLLPRMGGRLSATPDGRYRGEGLESDYLPPRTDDGINGVVSSQWAPEDELQAETQRAMFASSGAGLLQLFTDQ